MERRKSNAVLTVGILALGAAGLGLMVWLSPQPPAPPAGGISPHGSAPAAGSAADLPVPAASDPFRSQLTQPRAAGTVPPMAAGTASTVPPGVDPFKEKLVEQARQATASPFSPALARR